MQTNLSLILIILTGLLTSKTDLTYRQIKNQHLFIVASAGVLVHIFTFLSQKILPTLQLLSLSAGSAIGLFLYLRGFWRGGDAKLFILYSFLMPATGYEPVVPLPCFLLFANAFTVGLLLLTPDLVRNVLRKRKNLFLRTISRQTLTSVRTMFLLALGISWIVFPLFTRLKIAQYGFLSFLVIYLFLRILSRFSMILTRRPPVFLAVAVVGFFFRARLDPEFLAPGPLLIYIAMILAYSILSVSLNSLSRHITGSKDRVPFAPVLFAGCLASYTPLLAWLMNTLARK